MVGDDGHGQGGDGHGRGGDRHGRGGDGYGRGASPGEVMKSKFFLAIFFQAKAFLSWCFYKSNLNPCFQRNTHLLTLRVW